VVQSPECSKVADLKRPLCLPPHSMCSDASALEFVFEGEGAAEYFGTVNYLRFTLCAGRILQDNAMLINSVSEGFIITAVVLASGQPPFSKLTPILQSESRVRIDGLQAKPPFASASIRRAGDGLLQSTLATRDLLFKYPSARPTSHFCLLSILIRLSVPLRLRRCQTNDTLQLKRCSRAHACASRACRRSRN
jgi:hypothetical protein